MSGVSLGEAVSLERLIEERHAHPGKWSCIRELQASTGKDGNKGRIDVAALCHWPSGDYMRVAYEVKRTRRDFERELANPQKREWVEKHFHYTWFVCSRNVCDDDEVPPGWGLLIPNHGSYELRTRKEAPLRRPLPMDEGLMHSVIRSVVKQHKNAKILADAIDLFRSGK